jgi:hypothetical protein
MCCIQVQYRGQQTAARIHSSSIFLIRVPDIVRTTLISTLYAKQLNPQIISSRRWQLLCLPKCLTTLIPVRDEIPKSSQSKVKTCISGRLYQRLTIVSFAMCCAMYQTRLIGTYLEMLPYFVV